MYIQTAVGSNTVKSGVEGKIKPLKLWLWRASPTPVTWAWRSPLLPWRRKTTTIYRLSLLYSYISDSLYDGGVCSHCSLSQHISHVSWFHLIYPSHILFLTISPSHSIYIISISSYIRERQGGGKGAGQGWVGLEQGRRNKFGSGGRHGRQAVRKNLPGACIVSWKIILVTH